MWIVKNEFQGTNRANEDTRKERDEAEVIILSALCVLCATVMDGKDVVHMWWEDILYLENKLRVNREEGIRD